MSRTRDFSKLINGIAADKITSGTFANARLSSSSVTQHVDLSSIDSDYIQLRQATADLSNLNASNLTSGTIPNARITLDANEIPSLPASKITSGTLGTDRIPSLATSKITSGSFDDARIPNLATSKITSGTFDNARISSGSVTQHASSVTNQAGSWSPGYNNFGGNVHNARYVKVGRLCKITLYGQCTSNTATDNAAYISGLPFTSWNSGNPVGGGDLNCRDIANGTGAFHIPPNNTILYLRGASDNSITTVNYYDNYRGHDMAYVSYFILNGAYITAS